MKYFSQVHMIFLMIIVLAGCGSHSSSHNNENPFDYTGLSRLTDPEENGYLLDSLPNDIEAICDIANVQLVHYRMLSQWNIPKSKWHTAMAHHDIKDILDTLKIKSPGVLSENRKLENRVVGACTKESIFLTSLLRNKGIPARIRVGYFTNLYRADNAIEFWEKVNRYERENQFDMDQWNSWTKHNIDVNRSIEHFVTEYWNKDSKKWEILDARPEFLEYHGVKLDKKYHLKLNYNYEFAWQVWLKRDSIEEDAYAERGWSAKTHIRYQMLLDFYSLLNHDGPAIFESNGIQTSADDPRRLFLEKDFDDLSKLEIEELDILAKLLSHSPSVNELIEFYNSSRTLKIKSIEEDKYSFIYLHNLNTTTKNK